MKRKSMFEFEDEDEEDSSKRLKPEKEIKSSEKKNKEEQNEKSIIKEQKRKEPASAKDFFKPRTKVPKNKNTNHLVAKSPATPGLHELKGLFPAFDAGFLAFVLKYIRTWNQSKFAEIFTSFVFS